MKSNIYLDMSNNHNSYQIYYNPKENKTLFSPNNINYSKNNIEQNIKLIVLDYNQIINKLFKKIINFNIYYILNKIGKNC